MTESDRDGAPPPRATPPHLRALRGTVVVRADPEALFAELEQHLRDVAIAACEQRGVFHLALSGGGTPRPFYERLARSTADFPWSATHLWLVDERSVPLDDERSNWRGIRQALADRVSCPRAQLHPVPVDAVDPAGEYEAEIVRTFARTTGVLPPRFDLALLGMGADAHTASLFPGSRALAVRDRSVTANDGPGVVPPPRVTLTFAALERVRELVVLVTGREKSAALARVATALARGDVDASALPIAAVDPSPHGGALTWYLDAAAATVSR